LWLNEPIVGAPDFAKSSVPVEANKTGISTIVPIVASLAALALITAILIFVVYLRRRRQSSPEQEAEMDESQPVWDDLADHVQFGSEGEYQNQLSDEGADFAEFEVEDGGLAF
jgi:flagellar biosynthesis/type III secretory pathway M-ring protein FliF/YscJ